MNFNIEGRRLTKLKDPVKTWLYELIIPEANLIAPGIITDVDDVVIRTRTASIPQRALSQIASSFMGYTQYFPGKQTFGNTISTTFEEFEDQKISLFIYAWFQAINDASPQIGGSVTPIVGKAPGTAAFPSKRLGLSRTMYLRMYSISGDPLPYQIKFINTWPETVEAIQLDNNAEDSMKISVNWRFDLWQLVKV